MNLRRFASALLFGIAAIASQAHALDDMRHGSWESGADEKRTFYSAATSNDSGNTLGLVCYVENGMCYWVLLVGNSCETDGTYLVLVNTSTGATTHQLTCLDLGETKMMVFNDFEAIEAEVRKNPRIGIAFPMRDGAFIVMRFPLDGASPAIDRAKRLVAEATKDSTVNQRL